MCMCAPSIRQSIYPDHKSNFLLSSLQFKSVRQWNRLLLWIQTYLRVFQRIAQHRHFIFLEIYIYIYMQSRWLKTNIHMCKRKPIMCSGKPYKPLFERDNFISYTTTRNEGREFYENQLSRNLYKSTCI